MACPVTTWRAVSTMHEKPANPKGIIQFDIVEAFGRCICQHQMSLEPR